MVGGRGFARGLAVLSAAASLSVLAVGCGAGLSKADADLRCDQEKVALSSFFDDKVYASCEACYEACGDNCVRKATSPISYSCYGIDLGGFGGSSGASTTTGASTGTGH